MTTPAVYSSLLQNFLSEGDSGFCVPLAVAVLLPEVPLDQIKKAFEEAGRIKRRGTNLLVLRKALASLGYALMQIRDSSFIQTYPGVHKKLRAVTSLHPKRFKKSFEGRNLLFWGNSHTWAMKDGEVQDWAHTRSLRVNLIWEIIPKHPDGKGGEIYREEELLHLRSFDYENRKWV